MIDVKLDEPGLRPCQQLNSMSLHGLTWPYLALHFITYIRIKGNYKQLHCHYTLLHACN